MKRFLVGVNGEHTPDPAYWRDRNEVIEADSEQEAKEKWLKIRGGWYCGEPITIMAFPYSEEEKPFPFGSDYKFCEEGVVSVGR